MCSTPAFPAECDTLPPNCGGLCHERNSGDKPRAKNANFVPSEEVQAKMKPLARESFFALVNERLIHPLGNLIQKRNEHWLLPIPMIVPEGIFVK